MAQDLVTTVVNLPPLTYREYCTELALANAEHLANRYNNDRLLAAVGGPRGHEEGYTARDYAYLCRLVSSNIPALRERAGKLMRNLLHEAGRG